MIWNLSSFYQSLQALRSLLEFGQQSSFTNQSMLFNKIETQTT